jgi:chemotaxis protein MotB
MIRTTSIVAAVFAAIGFTLSACAPPPPPPPPPPPAPHVPGPKAMSQRSLMTMAADLAFRKGSFKLSAAGRAKLDQLVPVLHQLRNGKVVVYGYTDDTPVGPRLKRMGIADNLDLSSKRAAEVVRYLAAKGVNPAIMSAKGRGDTHPVASNDTRQGRAMNRRIEVVVEQPTG